MNEIFMRMLAWIVGVALGVIFFGGLWWTIRKAVASQQPAFWFVGSLILRMGIVMVGFYFVGHGQWQRLLLCLAGFVVGRLLVTWMTRLSAPEGIHAT